MKKDERFFLLLMLESMEAIRDYTAGISGEVFLERRETQDAVCLRIQTLGEYADKLLSVAPEFETSHREIPWRKVIGLRHRISHAYMEIDQAVVWEVVRRDLPILREQILSLLNSLGGD
jgi:uncharacterized protein with HEPN domain